MRGVSGKRGIGKNRGAGKCQIFGQFEKNRTLNKIGGNLDVRDCQGILDKRYIRVFVEFEGERNIRDFVGIHEKRMFEIVRQLKKNGTFEIVGELVKDGTSVFFFLEIPEREFAQHWPRLGHIRSHIKATFVNIFRPHS